MKSKKQVLSERPEMKALINAVINGIGGIDYVEDVNNHGIDGGFGSFVYYKDTVRFYKRYRKMINQMIMGTANELGESPVEMVGGFNCLKAYNYKSKTWEDEEMRDEIGVCIYGGKLNVGDRVPNALAFFAAEEVCRLFED